MMDLEPKGQSFSLDWRYGGMSSTMQYDLASFRYLMRIYHFSNVLRGPVHISWGEPVCCLEEDLEYPQ